MSPEIPHRGRNGVLPLTRRFQLRLADSPAACSQPTTLRMQAAAYSTRALRNILLNLRASAAEATRWIDCCSGRKLVCPAIPAAQNFTLSTPHLWSKTSGVARNLIRILGSRQRSSLPCRAFGPTLATAAWASHARLPIDRPIFRHFSGVAMF
jgi:hypothetical protein